MQLPVFWNHHPEVQNTSVSRQNLDGENRVTKASDTVKETANQIWEFFVHVTEMFSTRFRQ